MKINNEVKMIVGIVVVCILLIGAFIKFAPSSSSSPARDLSLLVRENSRMTGKIGAKATLVEFADYQCPACASLDPVIKAALAPYLTNPDFNYVYRNFPLSQHGNAVISAEAAEAAGTQGKYWEMHGLLYKNQTQWAGSTSPIDIFVGYARELGLDTVKFKADLDQHKYLALVQADLQDAEDLVLTHTPTFFLNGVEVTELAKLKEQIDSALAK